MRYRRLLLIGLSLVVVAPLTGCGNDAPDMGSATLPSDDIASRTESSTFDEGAAAAQLIGTTVGDLAPASTTTTTEPSTTGGTHEASVSPAAEAAEISALCGDVFDVIVRVQSADTAALGPDEQAALADITVDLLSRITALQTEVSEAGYVRLEECRTGLEDNTV